MNNSFKLCLIALYIIACSLWGQLNNKMSFLAIIWQMCGLFLTLSYHIYHILQKTWNTAHKSCAPLLWYDKVERIIGAEFLGELFLRKLQGSQIKNNKTRSKTFWKPQKYDTKKLIRNCGLWSLNRKMHWMLYDTESISNWVRNTVSSPSALLMTFPDFLAFCFFP